MSETIVNECVELCAKFSRDSKNDFKEYHRFLNNLTELCDIPLPSFEADVFYQVMTKYKLRLATTHLSLAIRQNDKMYVSFISSVLSNPKRLFGLFQEKTPEQLCLLHEIVYNVFLYDYQTVVDTLNQLVDLAKERGCTQFNSGLFLQGLYWLLSNSDELDPLYVLTVIAVSDIKGDFRLNIGHIDANPHDDLDSFYSEAIRLADDLA